MITKKVHYLALFGGVANLGVAISMLFDLEYCTRYDYCWHWGKYHFLMGIIPLFIGVFMVIMAFRKGQRDYMEMFICPKCETTATLGNVPDEQCPQCQMKMEPLAGFYKRHPDLKEK